jgi:hypothetical protein
VGAFEALMFASKASALVKLEPHDSHNVPPNKSCQDDLHYTSQSGPQRLEWKRTRPQPRNIDFHAHSPG